MSEHNPVVERVLYVIRHGESKGNVRTCSDGLGIKELADPPLTEKGKAQAKALGEYLKDIPMDGVFASGLLRAVETATFLLKNQSDDLTLEILPDLTEVGLEDDYPGASMDEIKGINPNAVLAEGISQGSSTVAYSSGSDEDALFERAKRVLDYIGERYTEGETVALVSHAAFITYIVFSVMGYEKTPIYDINFFNTSITKITFYKKGTNRYGDIVFDYINSTNHLEGRV